MNDIARLNELYAATTPGEWRRCAANGGRCSCGLVWSLAADAVLASVASDDDGPIIPDDQKFSNGDFIAAMHNAWPDISRRLAMLEEFASRVGYAVESESDRGVIGLAAEQAIDWLDSQKKAGDS